MGTTKPPLPAKLIFSMFTGDEALFGAAREALVGQYGPIDYACPRMPYDETDYYADEFGERLMRELVSFERLIDPGELAAIKVASNALEKALGIGSTESGLARRINLDPGYVNGARLVLASTKDSRHRIYLSQGIYAEVTLVYARKDFQSLPWTYPDYASDRYRAILRVIRAIYLGQLRDLRARGELGIRNL